MKENAKEVIEAVKPILEQFATNWLRLEVLESDYIETVARLENKPQEEVKQRLQKKFSAAKHETEMQIRMIVNNDFSLNET